MASKRSNRRQFLTKGAALAGLAVGVSFRQRTDTGTGA